MTPEQQEKVRALLEANHFAVISTYPSEKEQAPESALVGISETEELYLVFGTYNTTRKCHNISRDHRVSAVVGFDAEAKKTLQVEGEAYRITDPSEKVDLEAMHCKKNPVFERFIGDPRQEYFKIIPQWIRYTDYSVHPQEIWEVRL